MRRGKNNTAVSPNYTRTRRCNGRFKRIYIGGGLVGQLAAQEDAERRRRLVEQHQRADAEQERFEREKKILGPLETCCKALMTLALQAAGFHQHDRGEWRKRRMKRLSPEQKQLTRREKIKVEKWVDQASEGAHEALPELKRLGGRQAEYGTDLIHQHGNAGRYAEQILIGFIVGEDIDEREARQRDADTVRAELAEANSSPLESLLIDQIVVCWLYVNAAQAWCAAGEYSAVGGRTEKCLQRRLSYAHQRFLQACKALAQVRKLMGVNIQVNIAEKQINMINTG